MTGLRPLQRFSSGLLFHLARLLSASQETIAWHMGFEHWPAFVATWRELVALFSTRTRDLFILSGDVHFSYSLSAQVAHSPGSEQAVLYQLVASPFRNELGPPERRLIVAQAWLKRATYGGLHLRMLPLAHQTSTKSIPSSLLMQNVIALVRYVPHRQDKGQYRVQQAYMGSAGAFGKAGATEFPNSHRLDAGETERKNV